MGSNDASSGPGHQREQKRTQDRPGLGNKWGQVEKQPGRRLRNQGHVGSSKSTKTTQQGHEARPPGQGGGGILRRCGQPAAMLFSCHDHDPAAVWLWAGNGVLPRAWQATTRIYPKRGTGTAIQAG